ncbi:facilitated trehalose transporter Tret1-like [Periplaneta americana]|uniref:facilitated trehalose transporter Tret1-like n=1 Tax=Periplaneta americana TaxID=6978 RepID=UPI0037E7702D
MSNIDTQNDARELRKKKWKSKLRQIIAASVANLSSVAYGMAMSWPTPSLPLLKTGKPLLDGRIISVEEETWLGSLVFFGALVSSPISSYVSQKYGRKIAGYSIVIPFIVSWLFIVLSESLYLFYISRFSLGLCCGGVLVFCPMYVGEIAEDSIRGALGTFRSALVDIAFIIMYAVGPLISIKNMAIICVFIPIVFAFGYYWMPESPLYLMKNGRSQEAMESLLWLRGGDAQAAEVEMMKLTALVKKNKSVNTSIKSLLSSRGTRRALVICIVLGASIQLSGIYPVLNYAVSIFEQTGGSVDPNTATLIIAIVQMIGSLVALFLLDIAGRRLLIIVTQTIMCICLAGLGIYFFLQQQNYDLISVGFLPILFVGLFVFLLSVGLGTVGYVVMSEMFKAEARGIATTVTTITVWLTAFISTKLYVNIIDLLGLHGCYWLFAFFCIGCAVFTIFKVPETKNRSLESILHELDSDVKSDEEGVEITAGRSKITERY